MNSLQNWFSFFMPWVDFFKLKTFWRKFAPSQPFLQKVAMYVNFEQPATPIAKGQELTRERSFQFTKGFDISE